MLQKSAKIQHMLASKFDITDRKVAFVLILLVVAFVILTLTQDYVRSDLKNSAFYFPNHLCSVHFGGFLHHFYLHSIL